ncbi:hypothetical protein F0160_22670 [Paraburkholderia sp. JPY303]|uniref:hypothetical protein n=1 Tax=Paraburkholderia atlantica TaxID=2654982 RepID=UPI001590E0A3|nr:hypothetical protein [Paraburkholderia atlantica]NUY33292.1 hypothetical protein [Paraburkholderia atlantica]
MKTTYHEEDNKIHVKYSEDVESLLDYAHAKRVQEGEFEKMGEFKHVMRVPMSVMLDIKIRYGWDYMDKDHWPMVQKILKGPEYAKFRTTNRQI